VDNHLGKSKYQPYIHINQKLKNMTSKSLLRLFRIIMAFFLILSFMAFHEADNVIGLFGMMLTVMMAIAYIAAEIISAFDEAKQKQ
jgi:hypothetical protein